jgi:hypothetical protein
LVISDSLTSKGGYKISTISVADQIGLGIMAINSKSSYEYLKKKDFKMSKRTLGKYYRYFFNFRCDIYV